MGALESSGVMIGGGWEKEQRGKGREGVRGDRNGDQLVVDKLRTTGQLADT